MYIICLSVYIHILLLLSPPKDRANETQLTLGWLETKQTPGRILQALVQTRLERACEDAKKVLEKDGIGYR